MGAIFLVNNFLIPSISVFLIMPLGSKKYLENLTGI